MVGKDLGDGARQDYQRALDSYESAKQAVGQVTEAEQIKHVIEILEDGRYAMACVRARVNGEPLPQRRPSCFFNPQHGPSVEDVLWSPPGGAPREVPACAADAERVRAGAEPDVRKVMVGPQRVPYWEAGPAYSPYAQGMFGALGGVMTGMFLGTMLGGMFAGGGYGDYAAAATVAAMAAATVAATPAATAAAMAAAATSAARRLRRRLRRLGLRRRPRLPSSHVLPEHPGCPSRVVRVTGLVGGGSADRRKGARARHRRERGRCYRRQGRRLPGDFGPPGDRHAVRRGDGFDPVLLRDRGPRHRPRGCPLGHRRAAGPGVLSRLR